MFVVHSARVADANISPGELRVEDERLLVGAGSATALELVEIQLEGKKRMNARDFLNGYQPKAGERLGQAS
jgi:methionyl-tRNA formyltransferase